MPVPSAGVQRHSPPALSTWPVAPRLLLLPVYSGTCVLNRSLDVPRAATTKAHHARESWSSWCRRGEQGTVQRPLLAWRQCAFTLLLRLDASAALLPHPTSETTRELMWHCVVHGGHSASRPGPPSPHHEIRCERQPIIKAPHGARYRFFQASGCQMHPFSRVRRSCGGRPAPFGTPRGALAAAGGPAKPSPPIGCDPLPLDEKADAAPVRLAATAVPAHCRGVPTLAPRYGRNCLLHSTTAIVFYVAADLLCFRCFTPLLARPRLAPPPLRSVPPPAVLAALWSAAHPGEADHAAHCGVWHRPRGRVVRCAGPPSPTLRRRGLHWPAAAGGGPAVSGHAAAIGGGRRPPRVGDNRERIHRRRRWWRQRRRWQGGRCAAPPRGCHGRRPPVALSDKHPPRAVGWRP